MTPRTRRRPPVGAGARQIGRAVDRGQSTASVRHDRPPAPYDPVAEKYALAGAIAGPDLSPGDLDDADYYVPSHARLAAAVRLLDAAGEPTVRRSVWRTRYGRQELVCELPGLAAALAAVGSPDVARDLDLAAEIMVDYPGRRAELDRVRDLARRRRRLAELEVERDRLIEGVA